MKTRYILFGILSMVLVNTSCEKDESDCSNNGSIKGGYIKANISGESQDGVLLNESFTADKYACLSVYQDAYYSYYPYEDQLLFHIERSADNIGSGKFIAIDFWKSSDSISKISIRTKYQKIMDDNQVLSFYGSNYVEDAEFTNFSFDSLTGTLKSDYKVTYKFPIGDTATRTAIVTGDFNVQVTKIFHK